MYWWSLLCCELLRTSADAVCVYTCTALSWCEVVIIACCTTYLPIVLYQAPINHFKEGAPLLLGTLILWISAIYIVLHIILSYVALTMLGTLIQGSVRFIYCVAHAISSTNPISNSNPSPKPNPISNHHKFISVQCDIIDWLPLWRTCMVHVDFDTYMLQNSFIKPLPYMYLHVKLTRPPHSLFYFCILGSKLHAHVDDNLSVVSTRTLQVQCTCTSSKGYAEQAKWVMLGMLVESKWQATFALCYLIIWMSVNWPHTGVFN